MGKIKNRENQPSRSAVILLGVFFDFWPWCQRSRVTGLSSATVTRSVRTAARRSRSLTRPDGLLRFRLRADLGSPLTRDNPTGRTGSSRKQSNDFQARCVPEPLTC